MDVQSELRGLVAEQDIRIFHDGTADTGPLLLAAGELVWQLVTVLIEPQRVKQLVDVRGLSLK